jgi:hypothetical protein
MDGSILVPPLALGQPDLAALAQQVSLAPEGTAAIDTAVAFALGEGTRAERAAYLNLGGADAFAFLDDHGDPAHTSAFLRSIGAPRDWVREAQRKSWNLQIAAPRSRDFDAAETAIPSCGWLASLEQSSRSGPVTAQIAGIRRFRRGAPGRVMATGATKPLAILAAALLAQAAISAEPAARRANAGS